MQIYAMENYVFLLNLNKLWIEKKVKQNGFQTEKVSEKKMKNYLTLVPFQLVLCNMCYL